MKYNYLFLLLFIPFLNFSQIQIGQDIDGEAVNDYSGNSVSLSSDGSIVAIGAPFNSGNGTQSGQVRVYKNVNSSWVQIGQDIDGEAAYDGSGYSLSLSSDGSIVAIGAIGNDGNGLKSGHVRIYKNVNSSWVQIGQDIDGEAAYDNSGFSLSLSSDGSIVAIGSYYNDGNVDSSGQVRVYKNVNSSWVQIGQDIDGEAANNYPGYSVSLSSDGYILAIGGPINIGNGQWSGHVRIYKNENNSWIQVGQDIEGENTGDGSGVVSLSSDGSIVAIGADFNYGNVPYSGQVRVYKNVNSSWVQIGQDINGEAAYDYSGRSVSLSSDGSVVAIGAIRNDGNGSSSGHVRVYDLSTVLSTDSFNYDHFTYSPNPAQDVLNINLNPGLTLKQVNIYSIESKYLYSVKDTKIDVNNLASGMYFFEVETNKGKSTKKIVVE